MMEWAEKQEAEIGPPGLVGTEWEFAMVSDQQLYDSFAQLTDDQAHQTVGNHVGHGFEAWGRLCKTFDPMTEVIGFKGLVMVMQVKVAKSLADPPREIGVAEDGPDGSGEAKRCSIAR